MLGYTILLMQPESGFAALLLVDTLYQTRQFFFCFRLRQLALALLCHDVISIDFRL